VSLISGLRALFRTPPGATVAEGPRPQIPVLAVNEAPRTDALGLMDRDYAAVAVRIGCTVPAIRAVAEVESAGRGFLPDGRPAILFEAHQFHRLTRGRFGAERDRFGVPLSVPSWRRDLYGPPGAHQYARLEDAMKLDERAAVFATSWGTFQIMGFNFAALGFPDVDTFREVIAATDQAREHLDMFVQFILVNGLDDELRDRRWADFARVYNGPGYAANRYHVKMAEAFARHSAAGPW
jgi:hypothetical protein